MKNFNKEINICFCSDENLIKFIPIVINSILRKNSTYKINIYYIHNIINRTKINNLKKYINKYDNLKFFSYYKTWDRKYNGIKHVSVATMLRIFIPDIIKCDKIIYFDIDIVVNLDLNELYNINCGKTGIAIKNSIRESIEYFDKKSNKKSGNCGIIVMNLKTLRNNNFTEKCLEIHSKNENQHDQYIINCYADGNHTVLEPRFNIFLNQDDYLINKESEFILHYAGCRKPYFENTGKYQYLWDENDLEKIVKKKSNLKISSSYILPINHLINNTIIDELYYNMYNIKTTNIKTRKSIKNNILTNYYNSNKQKFKNDLLIIDYSNEGTQFTENINFIIDILTKLSKKKIICLSANYLSKSNNIKYYNKCWDITLKLYKIINYNNNRKNNFLLISGSTTHKFRKNKLIILLYLFKEKILDKGIFSLTNIKNYNDSLQDYFISNKFSDLPDVEKKYFQDLKNISPKIIDVDPNNKNENQRIFSEKMIDIIKDTNFHIILETEYTDSDNKLCRYTEKITKILAIGTPFVVFGCYKVLELLKKDGFKTFSPFINEEYDLIDNLELRTKAIIKEINRLCELSQLEWEKIHEKMKNIKKHNILNLKRLISNKYIYK